MIPAFGRQNQNAGIPTQNGIGLALLILLMAASGAFLVMRMRQ